SLFSVVGVYAQDEVEVTTTKLSDSIHMLVGKGGNVGVFIGQDGTFVIDDQFAPMTEKLMAAIETLGGDSPRFLINTHYHGDHTGGNENFGDKGAMIVSHDNVRTRLAEGSMIKAFGMETPPAAATALPIMTYSANMHFHINDENVSLVHVPNAHTDGDTFIVFKNANVVHTGDIFFNGFYPFIDGDHGGSVKGMIDAADVVLAISDDETKIIPGHGPLADKAQLQAYRDMLETAYTALLALKNEGLTADEAIMRKPLASLDAQWGGGLFSTYKWIGLVYPALN
ncbi:MAG: MBL fold metallo-hydrolase, partial [Methylococcales bacterium]|nr:MBL fold metallo-hydrolase [Methylococcales bacterium]